MAQLSLNNEKRVMRMNHEPQFALFVANDDRSEKTRGSLNLLDRRFGLAVEKLKGFERFGDCAALIPLPDGLPVLANLVDCVEGKMEYRVRLFGHPMLEYPAKPI